MTELNWRDIAFFNDLDGLKEKRIGVPPAIEVWRKYPDLEPLIGLESLNNAIIVEGLKRYSLSSEDIAYIVVRNFLIHEKFGRWPSKLRKKISKYRSKRYRGKLAEWLTHMTELPKELEHLLFAKRMTGSIGGELVAVYETVINTLEKRKGDISMALDDVRYGKMRSIKGKRDSNCYAELCWTIRDEFCYRAKSKNLCEGHRLINEIVSLFRSTSYQPSNLKRELRKIRIGGLAAGF